MSYDAYHAKNMALMWRNIDRLRLLSSKNKRRDRAREKEDVTQWLRKKDKEWEQKSPRVISSIKVLNQTNDIWV